MVKAAHVLINKFDAMKEDREREKKEFTNSKGNLCVQWIICNACAGVYIHVHGKFCKVHFYMYVHVLILSLLAYM